MVKKVLVVDDDHATLLLVKRALALKGYNVICASDGLDALVQIKKEKPDLVILDVMMPEINGYDVCYQLRFNKDFEQVPIILLTNRDQELDDSLSQRLNIEYLSKPFDTQVLLKKVETFL
ncbi:MAG TPA: two-component system response regulator [Candidatus Omnitrophica bacterium]|nr:MAG: hypothetical protein A2Z81_00990 [Omnitrophica WOR_2 bacterium GWA2_45_18]OGX19403.1 MAG: hypothetical protein A2Y04_00420 [Omnitrophica WOR_2 bacterium GWC2_45_7]HBR14553.1 two-component system response regulator [Candidatus Omnitrophota bacterium]